MGLAVAVNAADALLQAGGVEGDVEVDQAVSNPLRSKGDALSQVTNPGSNSPLRPARSAIWRNSFFDMGSS